MCVVHFSGEISVIDACVVDERNTVDVTKLVAVLEVDGYNYVTYTYMQCSGAYNVIVSLTAFMMLFVRKSGTLQCNYSRPVAWGTSGYSSQRKRAIKSHSGLRRSRPHRRASSSREAFIISSAKTLLRTGRDAR